MDLSSISNGDTVQFITKVDNSSQGQQIQHVILKVTEITPTHIRGVNAMRALNLDDGRRPYRSYKVSNIVQETVWKLVS